MDRLRGPGRAYQRPRDGIVLILRQAPLLRRPAMLRLHDRRRRPLLRLWDVIRRGGRQHLH